MPRAEKRRLSLQKANEKAAKQCRRLTDMFADVQREKDAATASEMDETVQKVSSFIISYILVIPLSYTPYAASVHASGWWIQGSFLGEYNKVYNTPKQLGHSVIHIQITRLGAYDTPTTSSYM